MKYRFFIFCLFVITSSCKQQSVMTKFLEGHNTGLQLYFYPSTLRMVNIDRNPEFDAMIEGVDQARFVRLDSGQITDNEIAKLQADLQQSGYEEVMSIRDKERDITLMALEKDNPVFVAISRSGHECMLLEIQGMINVTKLPGLVQTFNENGFLDVLNLNNKKKKK